METLCSLWALGMHELHAIAVFPQQCCDGFCMINIPGNHKSRCIRMALPHVRQLALRSQQHLLTDAAAIGQADGAAKVAGSPAFPMFGRQG
ncbi:hypothetical protein WH5701_00425 [Synechococcus sp. WH 5701]|nr:hypothetical protein WH5701_00425 [Synechococcus sp. WH 5701]